MAEATTRTQDHIRSRLRPGMTCKLSFPASSAAPLSLAFGRAEVDEEQRGRHQIPARPDYWELENPQDFEEQQVPAAQLAAHMQALVVSHPAGGRDSDGESDDELFAGDYKRVDEDRAASGKAEDGADGAAGESAGRKDTAEDASALSLEAPPSSFGLAAVTEDVVAVLASERHVTQDSLGKRYLRSCQDAGTVRPKYFNRPTFCGACKEFVVGITAAQQDGVMCSACGKRMHRRCATRELCEKTAESFGVQEFEIRGVCPGKVLVVVKNASGGLEWQGKVSVAYPKLRWRHKVTPLDVELVWVKAARGRPQGDDPRVKTHFTSGTTGKEIQMLARESFEAEFRRPELLGRAIKILAAYFEVEYAGTRLDKYLGKLADLDIPSGGTLELRLFNGQSQSPLLEKDIEAEIRIHEEQTKLKERSRSGRSTRSCPLVYFCPPEGAPACYETDVGGTCLVSGVYDIPGGRKATFAPMDVVLRNKLESVPVTGPTSVDILVLEGQDEVSYIDHISLRVLQCPRDDALLVASSAVAYDQWARAAEQSNDAAEQDPLEVYEFSQAALLRPFSARWNNEIDVTSDLGRSVDPAILDDAINGDIAAYADPQQDNFYQLRFKTTQSLRWLVVRGWKTKAEDRELPKHLWNRRPRLLVRSGSSGTNSKKWVLAKKLTFPRGDKKVMAFDISAVTFGAAPNGDPMTYDMRLCTGTSRDGLALWMIHSVCVSTAAPTRHRAAELPVFYPSIARVVRPGMPSLVAPAQRYPGLCSPLTSVPDGGGEVYPPFSDQHIEEGCTDGPVQGLRAPLHKNVKAALRSAADGQLTTLAPGDGISLKFIVDLPGLQDPRLETRLLLRVEAAYKPRIVPGMQDPIIGLTQSLAPLPVRNRLYR